MTLPYCILLLILPVVLPLASQDLLRRLVQRRGFDLKTIRRMYASYTGGILAITLALVLAVSDLFGQGGDSELLLVIGGGEVVYIVGVNVVFFLSSSKWVNVRSNGCA